jgi:hypothetical protein
VKLRGTRGTSSRPLWKVSWTAPECPSYRNVPDMGASVTATDRYCSTLASTDNTLFVDAERQLVIDKVSALTGYGSPDSARRF